MDGRRRKLLKILTIKTRPIIRYLSLTVVTLQSIQGFLFQMGANISRMRDRNFERDKYNRNFSIV